MEVSRTRDDNAQARMHIQRHMNNAWCELVDSLFDLFYFIVCLLFLGSHKQYGIIVIPLGPMLWPCSNLIVSHASSIIFLLTTNNLMLHLQHSHFVRSQRLVILFNLLVSQPYIMRIEYCP